MIRKGLITLAYSCITMIAFAGEPPQKQTTDTARKLLTFSCGGEVAVPPVDIKKYIQEHLRYPTEAIKADIQGRIFVTIIVHEDGTISDAKVVKGQELGYGLPEEAIRVIKSIPGKWKPAISLITNKPAACVYTIPVVFLLQ